jgi:predicted nucleotidyltransferase
VGATGRDKPQAAPGEAPGGPPGTGVRFPSPPLKVTADGKARSACRLLCCMDVGSVCRIRTMQGIDPELQSYLDGVVATLRDQLGAGLVGVYLHGSLVMGAFDPWRSDVDVLAVCAAPLSRKRCAALGEALAAIPRPRSGCDLEFSLVTEAAVRSPSAVPPFEVHVSTHEQPSVVDGHDRPGDEDLVIHFAMARGRGRALTGRDPSNLFAEPDRASLIRAILRDIDWAREQGAAGWNGHRMPDFASMAYRVLNAARSWRYVETGDLGSKVEGAEWLKRRDPDRDLHDLLDAALAFQRGDRADRPDERTVDAFVDRVEAMLRRAI